MKYLVVEKKPKHLRRKRRTKLEKQLEYQRYRLARLQRTPKWADAEKIEEFYSLCRSMNKKAGRRLYQVDHIIPLRGKTVSGLHVHTNLQITTKKANRTKSNKFNPDEFSINITKSAKANGSKL